MDIANVIKRRRTDLGMRQSQLAAMAGISEDYLSAIERGRRQPSMEVLGTIASALRVPAAYLVLQAEVIEPSLSKPTQEIVADAKRVAAELLERIGQVESASTAEVEHAR